MVYWVPRRVLSVEKKISGSNSSQSLGSLVQVFEQCGYLLVRFHYVYIKLLLRLAVGTVTCLKGNINYGHATVLEIKVYYYQPLNGNIP